jgi:outer membrane PBP1 activator LpoA protein
VPTSDCSRLDADLALAEQARREADDKQADAWKAVVPFAVAARYASAKAAAAHADKQIEALRNAAARQDCVRAAS